MSLRHPRRTVAPDDGAGVLRAARPGVVRPGSTHPAAARPHVAARLEDAFDRVVAARLRARGWTVRIEPYTGYGGDGWVRVLARTLLAAPGVGDDDLPGTDAPARAVRGWRSFATAQVAGAPVTVQVGDRTHALVTDRGGYVDQVVASDLEPGWHEVVLTSVDGSRASAAVQVVGPETRHGIVSDIDDTVVVTRLPRPLVAAWNVLVRHGAAREPVPGMAELYRELLADAPDSPVVYLSTGAWNAAPAMSRFLRRGGYPRGAMLMTDWGPTNTGWFRSGARHKAAQLRRLVHELPHVRWVLVGDDGQHDPEIYAGAAQRYPDRVHAILLRQLTFSEHVLAHGVGVPAPATARAERDALRDGVSVLQGADGRSLLRAIRARGIRLD
ncbi:App1 family protein [Cellulomonas sp. HZM]|uniref:App1 family protein n=1 Tax=Cellulomonas sp. HZM TaxID=1454010 RepID=UPI000A9A62E8|nr:phosphatase domain-containing protein [Cellulomonas sp. HZM]